MNVLTNVGVTSTEKMPEQTHSALFRRYDEIFFVFLGIEISNTDQTNAVLLSNKF